LAPFGQSLAAETVHGSAVAGPELVRRFRTLQGLYKGQAFMLPHPHTGHRARAVVTSLGQFPYDHTPMAAIRFDDATARCYAVETLHMLKQPLSVQRAYQEALQQEALGAVRHRMGAAPAGVPVVEAVAPHEADEVPFIAGWSPQNPFVK